MFQNSKTNPNKIKIFLRSLVLFFICSFLLCFGSKGIILAQDITIDADAIWNAGTYSYQNVHITNNAKLILNGKVVLNASSLIIDFGSILSEDGKGYPTGQGPGAGTSGQWRGGSGGSYGGKGGIGTGLRTNSPTYGSATLPVDLGSGGANGPIGNGGAGGGAIQIDISETLTVNGLISANGQNALGSQNQSGGGSGGSVYIITKNLGGAGLILANGGNGGPLGGSYGGGGGGGRIAVYYQTSNFTGKIEAKGGIGNGNNNGEDGTAGFFDTSNNYFYSCNAWRFQENDSPFVFNKAVLKNSGVTSEGNVNIAVSDFLIENSNFTISGQETLNITNLVLINSTITSLPQARISLNLKNLVIDVNSSVLADGKGYPADQGPGAGKISTYGGSGAGYGGRGGAGGAPSVEGGETYGQDIMPLDFGSGGSKGTGYYGDGLGGGAIKLNISDTLTVNGLISANGNDALQFPVYQNGGASGGSVYIIAKNFNGTGSISANGGKSSPTGGGAAGGGGGGGRIAIYYQTLNFTGRVEAKGGLGAGNNGEDGTIVVKEPSLNSPLTFFNLLEKSSTISNSPESFLIQRANLNNAIATGDLNGNVSFTDFEIVNITSGAFSGKGFLQGSFTAILEGVSYEGSSKGVAYFVPAERKIYLKSEISGGISGIAEGFLIETTPGSGIYDKYQAVWKINYLRTETASIIVNLKGTLSYQSSHAFTSQLRLYQANMEGSTFGHYTGPLSAVVTNLRITDENDYRDQGFSVISYGSSLGQGQAYSYNGLTSDDKAEFSGLFEAPILGKLSAFLEEGKTPKVLSGTIERLDFGAAPQPDLKVKMWSSQRVSPGEKVNYIIEYRNDGLKSASEAIVYFYPDILVVYKSASEGAYYNNYAHRISWNLGALPAKSIGYLSIQMEIPWGLSAHIPLENNAYILDIILHSTEENGVANGIRFDSTDAEGNKDIEQFVHDNNAKWFKLYNNTNYITGSLEAWLAWRDIVTSRNGVGQTSEIIGYRPKWIGFSGGGTTLINQVKQRRISGGTLYLISPQVVTQEDIRAAKAHFNKIIVYQGDDLVSDNIFLIRLDRKILLSLGAGFKPPDEKIEDLVTKIEQSEGVHKTLDYLEIFSREPGNRIIITWKDGYPKTEFIITNALQSEEGIEVITIPGIKHEEWFAVLTQFKEKYGRLPTIEDSDKLKEIFKKLHEESSSQSPQEIITANDPNEILVFPEGDVKPGSELAYTINYENIGEGIAFGIYISDTLEEDLDDSTLIINNGGSYDADTRTLNWFIGEAGPAQKGSVSYKVKVRTDALDKSEVINFATIYFPSVPQATRTNGAVNRITTAIDNVPPVTVATTSPLATQSGWNNTNVTVNLAATDNEGGAGIDKTEYSFDATNWLTYINPFSITDEGTTRVYFRSTDNAGNIESTKFLEIKIDKTPPIIIAQALPQPNVNGWNNNSVTVSFTATDALSGIVSVTEPITVTTEGKDQQIGGQVMDLAGNHASTSISLKIDKTPPAISLHLVPYKIRLPFKCNSTNFLLPFLYKLIYSASDNLSGLKNTKAGLVVPNINGFRQILIRSSLTNIVLDTQRRQLIIMAPNPAEILKQLKTNLLLINTNQITYLNLRPNSKIWTIVKFGKFLIINASSINFKLEATDYADNVSKSGIQYFKNKVVLPGYLKDLINNKKLTSNEVQDLMEDTIIDKDTLKNIWQKYKIK